MKQLGFLLSLVFLAGCASKPKKAEPMNIKGVFSKAVVEVKDLKTNEIHALDLNIYASFAKMRIESKATMLGIPVAVIVASQEKVEALLLRDKTYLVGPSEKIFKRLIRTPLKIGLIFKVVYHPEDPFFRKRCGQLNAEGRCWLKMGQGTIEWPVRDDQPKVFIIKSPDYEVTWTFNSSDFNWQPDPAVFELKVPSTFEKEVLN
ncbi:MAG: hypothetical protein V4736_04730 [Bdellovibrionota bacterium]